MQQPLCNPFLDSVFEVRWQACRPELVEPAITEALVEARGAIEKIASQSLDTLTFESTFAALEKATETLGTAWGLVTHLQSVADSPALREAHNAMLPQVSAFYSSIPLNPELWRRLKAFSTSAAAREVQGIKRRLMEETLADFAQAGADLPDEKRERLAALQSELAEATQKYSENVLDATNAWELIVEDEARLAGLPEHAKAAARQSAERAGRSAGWRFTLHQPSQEPVMVYAEDESLRRELWEAAVAVGTREPHGNAALVRQILTLRAEKAALLGKPHFAEVVLERRMAQSGARALAFVEDLGARAAAAFERDTAELEKFKSAQTGEPVARLAPWDLAFWAEKLRQQKHAFDEEALRPYFALGSVLDGLFELVRRVFGVVVKERKSGEGTLPETWHPEVRFYDLFDEESGEQLGSFYSDWHPRDSKRGGAWMNYLRTGERPERRQLGTDVSCARRPHLGLICGNLTPPVGERPALLTHREVETVFHEFGHLLHHLFGEVAVKSLNGVNVAWDFVELPSQIMENWCWEREALDLFARHYETGERIPDALFEAMSAARNFRSATFLMRQVSLAKLDLLLHTDSARYLAAPDIETSIRADIAAHLVPTEPSSPTVLTRFGHIFSDPVGYAAGYYSYQWAAVLDADAFTRFKREGIFNRQTGREFREKILARGNAEPPMDLYRDFMGREPDLQAHLARCGV